MLQIASNAELTELATPTLDLITANPSMLDRSIFQQLLDDSEREKNQFLLDNGLSPTFVDDVNGPWEMLLGRIARYVAGGPLNDPPQPGQAFSNSVQLVSVPTAATWDDPKYGPYQLCKVFGDSIPKWQAMYEPNVGTSFGDGYGLFVGSISIPAPTPSQQKEIDDARAAWQSALAKVRTREAGVGDRWTDFNRKQQSIPINRRLSYDQYYTKYEVPVLGSLRAALQGRQQVFVKKINDYTKGFGLVADMIARFSSENALFQTPSEGTGDDRLQNVYRYCQRGQLSHRLA
jgi:hypothetical protein